MAVVEELEQAVRQVAGRAGPAVVGIGHGRGPGSGVVVGEGVILTNAHNVRQGEVAVTFADGRQTTATLAGVDIDGDLAVLRADTTGVQPVEWAAGEAPRAGQVVFAAGKPGRPWRGHDLRRRHRCRPGVPWPPWPANHRQCRAFRPAPARRVGRPHRRR